MPARGMARHAAPGALRTALKQVFGFSALRPGQSEVIDRVLGGKPTLAIMPTGAGKSLCYQLPALLLPGRTVVVSPLIALMKDQCEALRARGITAVQLNSAVDSDEHRAAIAATQDGSAKIVMVTPERLAEPGFTELLRGQTTSLLVVDEAHCISQWGHDFRPAFQEIGPASKALGLPLVLALTATAAEDAVADICLQLGIPRDGIVHTGSYRPNLDLRVQQVAREADKLEQAVALVRGSSGSAVVYTATVKAAEALHDALAAAGEAVGLYHGRLPAARRAAAQEAFMSGAARVMVATNAFGLGIDKPDIRFVLHYQLPPNLAAYYQEAGRAGRDGEAATCTLLFLRADKSVQQFFMLGRYPGAQDGVALYEALMTDSPDGEGWTLASLQGRLARPPGKVRVALGLLRRSGIAEAKGGSVSLRRRDLTTAEIEALMSTYAEMRDRDREGLERMVAYAQSGQCRWRSLLEHMSGGSDFERCGHCDNCRHIAAHEAALGAGGQTDAPGALVDQPPPRDAHAFNPGDIVKVRRYGRGRVETASALQVTVAFADGNKRCFQPAYVSPLRGTPPASRVN